MVVAAGAVEGQADEGLADRAEHLLDLILTGKLFHPLAPTDDGVVHAGGPKAGRGSPLTTRNGLVANQLPPDKLVVGHVAVERIDHPVAVGPGMLPLKVSLKAIALAETHHIEPVTTPSLSVGRRCEQVVNKGPVGFIGRICGKGVDLLCAWRQADKIEEESP